MCRPVTSLAQLAVATLVACSSAASLAEVVPATAAAKPRVPFVVGLSTVRAVSTPAGDYETLAVITSIDASGYKVVRSGEVPSSDGGEPQQVTVTRKVLAADQASARKQRSYYVEGDPESFPGTVPGLSVAVVDELRKTGKSVVTYLDIAEFFGTSTIKGEYTGTLARVADPAPTLSVLVNGRSTALPVLHVKGTLSGSKGSSLFEYFILDDSANPLVLKWSGHGVATTVLRIEYPVPKESAGSIETALAKNEVAEVYGIYFSFNRADIRPESERVLQEIAGILKAHPQWKLRVDGHTDGIGNDAANLELSKRRSAAVKDALVSRFHVEPGRLVTGGYGESQPQATNDTPEGRARNRRVELRRE